MTVWLDADSCPVSARALLHRFSCRLQIPVVYVANHEIPRPKVKGVPPPPEQGMVIVGDALDAADDYIVRHILSGDLAITRDIPLAGRLVKKGITVLNDRGFVFTPQNIQEQLSERNFHVALAEMWIRPDARGAYGPRDVHSFANTLDRLMRSTH